MTTKIPPPADRSAPMTLKLFYGSGQAINAIVDGAINTFLLFYLTAVCGMCLSCTRPRAALISLILALMPGATTVVSSTKPKLFRWSMRC